MKGFIIKLIVVCSLCFGCVWVYLTYSYKITERILGPNTKHQIEQSFTNVKSSNYDILFVGNSRLYRGINPDIFSYKSYNFSYDGDTYLQTYYKLKYLNDDHINCKYVVISVDYFSFSLLADNSNGNYYNYLASDYKLICNSDLVHTPHFKESKKSDERNTWYLFDKMDEMNIWFNTWVTKNISNSVIPFFKGLKTTEPNRPFMRENGQYVVNTQASANDFIERSSEVYKPLQVYLDSALWICKKMKAKVFLTMLPTRQNELKNYTPAFQNEITAYFDSLANDTSVYFLSYKNDTTYSIADYADLTHFNELGANKFSKQLNKDIEMRLSKSM